MTKILFICLGNICRSVAAEGIMAKMAKEQNRSDILVDSAGLINYHEGELADPRMRAAAQQRGINLTHRSRPISRADFYDFDYIVAMDADNIRRLNRIIPADTSAKVVMAADYFGQDWPEDCVPDPYYSGPEAFEHCLDQLHDVCNGILKKL